MGKVSLKREITLLAGGKGLEDLDHMTDVCLLGIHSFKSLQEGACRLNAHKRLNDTLLNIIKHPSDDG